MIFKRGDQFKTAITIKDGDGTPSDITGATVFFTIRDTEQSNSINDDDAIVTKDITTHQDPTNGITMLDLSSTDTDIAPGCYYREIQLKHLNGDIVSTGTSTLKVLHDLTKRT